VLSIALNPVLFTALIPLEKWLLRKPGLATRLETAANPLAELPTSTERRFLSKQVVLVGWGRVGKRIADALTAEAIPYVVAEENREFVETLRGRGIPAVWGDATEASVLIQAHIRDAKALVIATPETIHVRKMVDIARTLNPLIQIVVRSHNAAEAELLESEGAGKVFVGESELANAMVRHLLFIVKPGVAEPP
jgi:CPA2 family monovalent cation:H+ antiporter-2